MKLQLVHTGMPPKVTKAGGAGGGKTSNTSVTSIKPTTVRTASKPGTESKAESNGTTTAGKRAPGGAKPAFSPNKAGGESKSDAKAAKASKNDDDDDDKSVGSTTSKNSMGSTASKASTSTTKTGAASVAKTTGAKAPPRLEQVTGPQLMAAVNDFDKKAMAAYLDFALALDPGPLPSEVLNFVNNGGNTPLMMACIKGKDDDSAELVQTLLMMKCDVNVQNKDKQNALALAVKKDFPETVRLLLQAGAEFWIKDKENFTPAQYAKDRLIVQMLHDNMELKVEAERMAAIAELGGILYEAILTNDVKQVKMVISREPPEETFSYCPRAEQPGTANFTALRLAVEKNYLEIVRLLVAANADGKQCDRMGRTPTMYLCAQKRVLSYPTTKNSRDKEKIRWTLLQALLEGNLVHLECRDKHGETALLLASNNGYIDDIRLLVEVGADVNARQVSPYPYRGYPTQRGKSGDTALILATRRGDVAVVKALVEEFKADIDLHGADGMTALMWAVWHERKDLIIYLHAKGADVNAQSWFGQTALMWTMEHMKLETAMFVLDLGYDTPVMEESKVEDKAGGGKSSDRGKSPDRGKSTSSPKKDEDKKKKKEMKKKKGDEASKAPKTVTLGLPPRAADPNIVTRNNASPLVVLCRKAPTMDAKLVSACIDLILSRGANINIRTNDGLTALMWGVINNDKGICRQLLFCGADPTMVDNLKRPPLECALDTVIRMLLKNAVEAFNEQKLEAAKRAAELEADMSEQLTAAEAKK